jgi:hypothetical protein
VTPIKSDFLFIFSALRYASGKIAGQQCYSHNCQFGLSQTHQADKTSMTTLDQVFPVLATLSRSGERVGLVNGGIVEEVLLPLGKLDFGQGVLAKCDIALWRTRGEHLPLVGEFAFQVKFDRKENIAEKQKSLRHAAARGRRMAGARRDQDRHGVPPQRRRASEP